VDKAATRDALTSAARLNLDTIARRGGHGLLRQAAAGRYTLLLPDSAGSMEPVHRMTSQTLRTLHSAGLIWYPNGEHAEPVSLTEDGWAAAEPTRAGTPA